MLSNTVRPRRSLRSANSNPFHQVRTQEYQRDQALTKLGAAEEQVLPSYFVPTLQSICADLLAKNFTTMPEVDQLQEEEPALYAMIVERLPVSESELPLRVSVPRVRDEAYWKRCCETRWSLGQLSKMSGERLVGKEYGWKRLFLEHVLSDFIMSLRSGRTGVTPSTTRSLRGAYGELPIDTNHDATEAMLSEEDARALSELCAVCRDYVHTIELPCQYSHLNLFENLFAKLPGILSFRLTYGASDAGVSYDRAMSGFTAQDADSVRYLLRKYSALERLRLPSNRLRGEHVMAICAGLVDNTTLRVLDLSSNAVDDAAVEGLSLLLCRPDFALEELLLGDNAIRGAGTRALVTALRVNKTLRVLQLNQNRIPDDAGAELVRALPHQPTLTELHLGGNRLGTETVHALRDTLPQLQTLLSLDLSGNGYMGAPEGRVEPAGSAAGLPGLTSTTGVGSASTSVLLTLAPTVSPAKEENSQLLVEAVRENTSLRKMDVRYCNLCEPQVATINSIVEARVSASRVAQVAAQESALRAKTATLVEQRVTRSRGLTQ